MKSRHFVFALCAALLGSLLPGLAAEESLKLEPRLYVFKDFDFARIIIGANTSAEPGRGIAFGAPVTVTFDQQALVLLDADYAWNGGDKVPAPFSMIASPVIDASWGRPATILCALPVQYLEKAADGSLQVREIPRDSPDVPHYQLTLTVRRAEPATADLVISGQLDIATMQGREKIPGVELDAGRPLLARFKENFKFLSPSGGWSGLVIRNPGGSDYSVLMLLKASPAGAAPATVGSKQSRPVPTSDGPTIVAYLEVSASDSIDLRLHYDPRQRIGLNVRPIRFHVTMQGKGPVYHDPVVRQQGSWDDKGLPHQGTVTLDPKQQWVVINLQEVVSKAGEPVRTEPCPANGKYTVQVIDTGKDLSPDRPARSVYPYNPERPEPVRSTRDAGPTPSEVYVPPVPGLPYVQPK